MVAGGILSWIGLIPLIAYFGENLSIPLFPETELPISQMAAEDIWYKYIRVIGAGAVAVGGIITVIKSLPTMVGALKTSLKDFRLSKQPGQIKKKRTDTDLPFPVLGFGILIVAALIILAPQVLGIQTSILIRLLGAVCIVIFAFCFVTVSSRIVGMVGVTSNPTSGMTIVTLLGTSLVFLALGWTDTLGMATALTVGTVVAISASIAGDISQDLKAGYIIGATPKKQQMSELIGVLASAYAIAWTVWLLGKTFEFGSQELAAPQATLMKTVIEGVLGGNLPWGLVLVGGAFAIVAELVGIPSLPFAVGIYLPLSTMTPIFAGGFIRHLMEKRFSKDEERKTKGKEKGILLGSGFIAGEGITMVGVALYAYISSKKPTGIGIDLGDFTALGAFLALAVYLYWKSSKK